MVLEISKGEGKEIKIILEKTKSSIDKITNKTKECYTMDISTGDYQEAEQDSKNDPEKIKNTLYEHCQELNL